MALRLKARRATECIQARLAHPGCVQWELRCRARYSVRVSSFSSGGARHMCAGFQELLIGSLFGAFASRPSLGKRGGETKMKRSWGLGDTANKEAHAGTLSIRWSLTCAFIMPFCPLFLASSWLLVPTFLCNPRPSRPGYFALDFVPKDSLPLTF